MSRASQSQPAKQQAPASSATASATAPSAAPAPAAPRKHPWLLALAILLLAGWLAFLAFMAFGL